MDFVNEKHFDKLEKKVEKLEDKVDSLKEDVSVLATDVKHYTEQVKFHVAGDNKIINESTREFSDVSLSDLYTYKRELDAMANSVDYHEKKLVEKERDKVEDFINSVLSKSDIEDLELQNSIMTALS